MFRLIKMLVMVGSLFPTVGMTAESADGTDNFTLPESELIALVGKLNNELRNYWKRADELEDPREVEAYYAEHDPAIEFMPKLLAFEAKYAGQDVGTDALGEIVSYAARGGKLDSPVMVARREVLLRLAVYENRELLVGTLNRLTYGRHDPQVQEYLRNLADSQEAHPTVSAVGRFILAKDRLNRHHGLLRNELRLQELAAGAEPARPNEAEGRREWQSHLPSAQERSSNYDEAVTMLEELANSGESFRLPRIRTIDPSGCITRIVSDPSEPVTFLSEKATAVLFKEKHLRVGRQAPELKLDLAGGSSWSIEGERGHVVLIQFSFTGCGPCERMYPDLRELREAYPERLSIVSIMRDKSPDSLIEAIDTGKFTWNVAWDENPGRVATRWAVDSFPGVFVIDQQGTIAAVGLRGEKLKTKIVELIETGP